MPNMLKKKKKKGSNIGARLLHYNGSLFVHYPTQNCDVAPYRA